MHPARFQTTFLLRLGIADEAYGRNFFGHEGLQGADASTVVGLTISDEV